MGLNVISQSENDSDAETVYMAHKSSCDDSEINVNQNTHRVGSRSSLFFPRL